MKFPIKLKKIKSKVNRKFHGKHDKSNDLPAQPHRSFRDSPQSRVNENPQEQAYQMGLNHYSENNFIEAVRHFEMAGEHPKALYYLAKLSKKGVPGISGPDEERALELYNAARNQENVHATYKLGKIHQLGLFSTVPKNIHLAEIFYDEAKETSARAQYKIGEFYHHGYGKKAKNLNLAAEWYKTAATNGKGDIEAMYYLAEFHINGKGGLLPDPIEGARLYNQVANSNHKKYSKEANYILGTLYEYGKAGFQKDLNLAMTYYKIAAEKGSEVAYTSLAETIFIQDFNVIANVAEAHEYLKKATDDKSANEIYAKTLIGFFYQMRWIKDDNLSPQQYPEKALEWHQNAIPDKYINSFAHLCIGLLYAENEIEDSNNQHLAEKYFQKAALAVDKYDIPTYHNGEAYILDYRYIIEYIGELVLKITDNNDDSKRVKKNLFTLLAIIYERGLVNFKSNISVALYCYQEAAANGGLHAKQWLTNFRPNLTNIELKIEVLQLQRHYDSQVNNLLNSKLQEQKKKNKELQYTINNVQQYLGTKIEALKNETTILDEKANNLISKHKNLELFYQILRIRVESIFTSIKAAAGGFTQLQAGNIGTANVVIELFGDIASVIPGAELAGILTKWVINKPLDELDSARQKNRVINLSDDLNLTEAKAKKYAANITFNLIKRFEEQLYRLATPAQEKMILPEISGNISQFYRKTKSKIKYLTTKNRHLFPAEKLAAFILVLILDNLPKYTNINDVNKIPFDEFILEKITLLPSDDAKKFWSCITQLFQREGQILAANRELWEPNDILTKPGIKTRFNFKYEGDNTDSETFGWCLGEISEALSKGFTQKNQPSIQAYQNNGFFVQQNSSTQVALTSTTPIVTGLILDNNKLTK